jgi:alpha-1,2-mannosyltransferase
VEALGHTAGSVPGGSGATRLISIGAHVRTVLEAAAFVLLPLIGPIFIAGYLVGLHTSHPSTVDGVYFPDGGFLFDLHVMWKAGHDIVIGHSPYPFVYPAPAAFLMVPFGLLSWKLAVVAFALVLIGSLVLAFRLLRVTDWRCYAAALACMPMASSITIGTLSPLLLLAAAAAWRYRNSRLMVAAALVGAVATKIFLWPLFFWLLATRRYRTAATTLVLGIVTVFGSWAILGFDGLREYPHRISRVAGLEQDRSYSPFSLARSLGMSTHATQAMVALLAVAAIAAIVLLARGRDGDRRAFVAAIGAGLILSPIVWPHYLVILFVPIALYRRRLSAAWVLPLLFWLLPGPESHGSAAWIGATLVTCAAAVVLAARPSSPAPSPVSP